MQKHDNSQSGTLSVATSWYRKHTISCGSRLEMLPPVMRPFANDPRALKSLGPTFPPKRRGASTGKVYVRMCENMTQLG